MSSAKGIATFSKTGIKWVRSDKPLPADDLYIRWGCTSTVPAKNVLNTAAAIHEVNDKAKFRVVLDEAELCPPTWQSIFDVPQEEVRLGVVFRPAVHSRGRHIYRCFSMLQLQECKYKHPDHYVSKFVDKVAEYRVCVVQGRAVWVAKKTPDDVNDLAWNVAKGGRFDNVRWDDWPLKAVKKSIEAFNLSNLDFGGVDVMVDKGGECYVVEINSAPSLTSPYRQECMAKAFDWIVLHGKKRIPLVEEKGGYSKFIHPAVCDRAKMLEPKLNQCDGCVAGHDVEGGLHLDVRGLGYMVCQKNSYLGEV